MSFNPIAEKNPGQSHQTHSHKEALMAGGNFMSHTICWFREPGKFQNLRKVLFFIATFAFAVTIIGLAVVIPGIKEWNRQTLILNTLRSNTAFTPQGGDSHIQRKGARVPPHDLKVETQAIAQSTLDLIKILKTLRPNPNGKVTHQGIEYTISMKDPKYKVTTWNLEINGRNVQVNEFDRDAYNGVKSEGFVNRMQLVEQAARKSVNQKVPPQKRDQVNGLIDQLNAQFLSDTQNPAYELDIELMKKGAEATDHYKQVHRAYLQRIAQYARDVQHVIDQSLPSDDAFTLDQLDLAERQCVLERDRPVIINTYYIKERQFVNLQIPETKQSETNDKGERVSGQTIPSSLRNLAGLANYVTTAIGVLEGVRVRIIAQASRHSCYPPIAIGDGYQRRAIAMKNVKQGLIDQTEKLLKQSGVLAHPKKLLDPRTEGTKANPLTIHLRSMMLLTPLLGDTARNRSKIVTGDWLGKSESMQMNESVEALRVFNGRTLPITIGDLTVRVKVDTSCMNLGANSGAAELGLFGKIPKSPEQERINARGFVEFFTEAERYIDDWRGLSKSFWSKIKDIRNDENSNEKHKKALGQLVKTLEEEKKSGKLVSKYENLEALYYHYEQTKNVNSKNPKLKKLQTKIDKIESEIEEREKIISQKYTVLKEIKEQIYLNNRTEIKRLEKEWEDEMKRVIDAATDGKTKAELTLIRNLQLNLFKAKELFYTKAYQKPETVLDFQALYIESQSMLRHFINFFCKSGEDRTGRMDNRVQERAIFYVLHDRLPMTDEDFQEINREIAPLVHQFSVSQNNTEYNSNARGLQISQAVNETLLAEIDKLHGSLAKQVLSHAKQINPSPFAVQLLKM